jgi:Mlc titration factor MtfA (ptsG expression regulator)
MIFTVRKYRLVKLYSLSFSIAIALSILGISLIPIIILYRNDAWDILWTGSGCVVLGFCLYFFFTRKYRKRRRIIQKPFPPEWERILETGVAFYSGLSDAEKSVFRQQVQIFLGEKRITGIETTVDAKCRVLVAASAVIPVFGMPDWEYTELGEILIYPFDFDENYDFGAVFPGILGLVTRGGSTVVLSKPSLYRDFSVTGGNSNVGIHEFVHKIDGEDGFIDGVPPMVTNRKLLAEWLETVKRESAAIENGGSDIDPYALSGRAEFFAVVSEYYFENPRTMRQNHPELYEMLEKLYKRDTISRFETTVKFMLKPYGKELRGREPCPCGSGRKYKHCCRGKNY